jgi:thymidine phosphorylase
MAAGAEPDLEAGAARARKALESGAAWQRFLAMVEAQGGDRASVERPDGLARAPVVKPVAAARAGVVRSIDTFVLGELAVSLGAGRRAKEDAVDPRVGLMIHARIGARVAAGERLAELHLAGDDEGAVARAGACFELGEAPVTAPPLVLDRVG